MDADTCFLELVRYIYLNPVRANLVKRPEAYPWSGHRSYFGEVVCHWLSTDWILKQFGKSRKPAQEQYKRFVLEGMNEGCREDFHRGTREGSLLGDEEFKTPLTFLRLPSLLLSSLLLIYQKSLTGFAASMASQYFDCKKNDETGR